MTNDTDIIALRQPESVDDPLTLAAALRAEADAFVAQHSEETLPDGRQRVVRHGYGPERSIQTGIGALDVRRPKVRDRTAVADKTAKKGQNRPSTTRGAVPEAIKPPSRRSRTRRSDVP